MYNFTWQKKNFRYIYRWKIQLFSLCNKKCMCNIDKDIDNC